MDYTQLLKDLDAPLVLVIGGSLTWQIIKYLKSEIVREREEKEAVIEKLEKATEQRMDDKDTAAEQSHETLLRVEGTLQRVSDSRTAVMGLMERIARKVGVDT